MTFVGKMLIVVQVVLSIVFMAFAGAVYSTQQSWREEAQSFEEQVADLQTEMEDQNTELQRQLDEDNQAMAAAVQRAEEAEGLNAQLVSELANQRAENNDLDQQLASLQGLAQSKSAEATYREEEAQRERVASATLREQTNELQTALRDRDDQIFALQLQLEDLANRYDTLLAESGDLKRILRQHDLPTDPAEYAALEEPPPPVDALVVETKQDKTNRTEFVEISVGSDDGVLKNHVLDVYSSGLNGDKASYKGKIQIVHAEPDRAVGYVIQSAKNGIIQRGDNVTTRL